MNKIYLLVALIFSLSACGVDTQKTELSALKEGKSEYINSPSIISIEVHSAIVNENPNIGAQLQVQSDKESIVISGYVTNFSHHELIRNIALKSIRGRANLVMDVVVFAENPSKANQARSE